MQREDSCQIHEPDETETIVSVTSVVMNLKEKFFRSAKANKEFFKYLNGYNLQSILSLTLCNDALDYINRNKMLERHRRLGLTRKQAFR